MPDDTRQADIDMHAVRAQLEAMNDSIAATRAEIAALDTTATAATAEAQVDTATGELDAIVEATEQATSTILDAAERMTDVAGRVAALDAGSADALAASETISTLTADIFTACSFQDITGQRISKVVDVLKDLEQRLAVLLNHEIDPARAAKRPSDPDAHLLNGPAAEGTGIDQDAVDAMFS